MPTEQQEQLESLHRRMDKFYEWAGVLQKEFRSMNQRLSFLESQCKLDLGQADRLGRLVDQIKK